MVVVSSWIPFAPREKAKGVAVQLLKPKEHVLIICFQNMLLLIVGVFSKD